VTVLNLHILLQPGSAVADSHLEAIDILAPFLTEGITLGDGHLFDMPLELSEIVASELLLVLNAVNLAERGQLSLKLNARRENEVVSEDHHC
jgi:hypothetical protein